MEHAKKGTARKNKVICIIAALVCVGALIAAICILGPDRSGTNGKVTTVSLAETATSSTTADTTVSTVTTVDTVVPGTTVDTSVTTGTTAVSVETDPPVDIPYVPSTEYIPPEGRDTDFSGCLFIGDSRTEGLMLYSGIYGATAYTARGLMVDTYFTSPVVNLNGSKVSVSEAVTANPGFSKVYIMLGVNELGWAYDSVFRDGYAKVIDHLKSVMPEAQIIVQSIIPVTASKSVSDSIYNNDNITRYNGLIKELCGEKGVRYVDLVPGLCGEYGALPEDAAFDGIHLKKSYCQRWLDCLKSDMQ